jgi:hypothetical protein
MVQPRLFRHPGSSQAIRNTGMRPITNFREHYPARQNGCCLCTLSGSTSPFTEPKCPSPAPAQPPTPSALRPIAILCSHPSPSTLQACRPKYAFVTTTMRATCPAYLHVGSNQQECFSETHCTGHGHGPGAN